MNAASLFLPKSTVLRGGVAAALGWWLREIKDCVPRSWLEQLPGRSHGFVDLQLSRDQARLSWTEHGVRQVVFLARTDNLNSIKSRSEVASLRGRRVTIDLAPDLLFRTEIMLPAAAQANLTQIIGNQRGLLVPLDPEKLVFAVSNIRHLPSTNTIRVLVVVATQKTIEAGQEFTRSLGCEVTTVVAMPEDGHLLTLYRPTTAASAPRRSWRRNWLDAAILLLAATLVATQAWRSRSAAERLETAIAAARHAAEDVRTLRYAVTKAEEPLTLLRRRLNMTPATVVIGELSRVIPDDTWVTNLTLKGGNLEFSGNATHATRLVSELETSRLFVQPHFEAPITGWPDGSERFTISAGVRSPP